MPRKNLNEMLAKESNIKTKEFSTSKAQSANGIDKSKNNNSMEPEAPVFEQKNLSLRIDQVDELRELAIKLKRAKKTQQSRVPGGFRLSESTIVRIAIDYLFQTKKPQLYGETEEEMFKRVMG